MSPQIPIEELKVGKFYKGEGRFLGDLAVWDGSLFVGFQYKFNRVVSTAADYGERGFSPLKEVA